ncbi:hypothetical protein N869_15315 [Cellulomonas bogoriensis 69B4 = DSM 16987]|uniref:Uncharacterized protein n=1 Tax=Cellulomonas bogoriensis 69B4 = DSM 16987 TaxID=1386082 RepID=A0A0A0BZC8_9CELL|nr:hypothetical protein N869_15315 [Cellulomonas bogoriensis 69B4 = DSM 16987]
MPTRLTATNVTASRGTLAVRVEAKAQYLLPSQATVIATATETTLAVRGLWAMTSTGPWSRRLKIPTSTTKATAPTEPKRTSCHSRAPIVPP